ncbi:hypothetical protein BDV95DRAFT_668653 [Massariosphaeria phaeospora]|uniref:Uncharacterized protein n=1 Tax=Massariosphaeria phaeospora TaxID=100035 RepID=A0A7C8M5Q4_9PLEO|nr:hypothetical protein BDV95DRAFT_668653 [Massariosphaeria phaeospora]
MASHSFVMLSPEDTLSASTYLRTLVPPAPRSHTHDPIAFPGWSHTPQLTTRAPSTIRYSNFSARTTVAKLEDAARANHISRCLVPKEHEYQRALDRAEFRVDLGASRHERICEAWLRLDERYQWKAIRWSTLYQRVEAKGPPDEGAGRPRGEALLEPGSVEPPAEIQSAPPIWRQRGELERGMTAPAEVFYVEGEQHRSVNLVAAPWRGLGRYGVQINDDETECEMLSNCHSSRSLPDPAHMESAPPFWKRQCGLSGIGSAPAKFANLEVGKFGGADRVANVLQSPSETETVIVHSQPSSSWCSTASEASFACVMSRRVSAEASIQSLGLEISFAKQPVRQPVLVSNLVIRDENQPSQTEKRETSTQPRGVHLQGTHTVRENKRQNAPRGTPYPGRARRAQRTISSPPVDDRKQSDADVDAEWAALLVQHPALTSNIAEERGSRTEAWVMAHDIERPNLNFEHQRQSGKHVADEDVAAPANGGLMDLNIPLEAIMPDFRQRAVLAGLMATNRPQKGVLGRALAAISKFLWK